MTFLRSLRRAILALSMAQALGLVSGGFSPGLAQAAELHYQYFFLPPGQTPQQVWKENAAAYPAAPRCVYAPAMDVEAIANDHRLTLLQAVEVVQQYFGLTQHQVGTDQDFEAAVKAVRRGDTRSGILETQLRQAPFIVVVDIDHTLLDQSVAHDANPDQSFRGLSGAMIHVRVAPGAFEFLQWVKGQGGMVVLMSRSASSKVTRLVGSIGLEGGLQRRPTLSLSQMVDGVMGYRYLFLTTADWLQNPTQMSAAYSPGVKKDLRLFSSVGQDKVIIVDDDPRFVRNQDRVFRIP